MDDANSPLISIKDALKDEKRIKYHNDHLMNLLAAIKYAINTICSHIIYSLSHVDMIPYALL
jgi:beta-glucosidase